MEIGLEMAGQPPAGGLFSVALGEIALDRGTPVQVQCSGTEDAVIGVKGVDGFRTAEVHPQPVVGDQSRKVGFHVHQPFRQVSGTRRHRERCVSGT
ncbi:hypothetical protein GCM10020295_04070 [Streptomyces cinereospinus]